MAGNLKKSKGLYVAGDPGLIKQGTIQAYPVPQATKGTDAKAQYKISSFYLDRTLAAASTTQTWAPISPGFISTPFVIRRIDFQVSARTSANAYRQINKAKGELIFQNGTSVNTPLGTIPISGSVSDQSSLLLRWQGPPDNNDISLEGNIYLQPSMTIVVDWRIWGAFAIGDIIYFNMNIFWSPGAV